MRVTGWTIVPVRDSEEWDVREWLGGDIDGKLGRRLARCIDEATAELVAQAIWEKHSADHKAKAAKEATNA